MIRLLLLGSLVLVGLAAHWPLPGVGGWLVGLLAREYGYWLILVIPFLVFPWSRYPSGVIKVALGLIAALLLTSSAWQAAEMAKTLNAELQNAFGPQQSESIPFSWGKLFQFRGTPVASGEPIGLPTRDGKMVPITFYRPTTPGPHPCILVLHTGGWNSGSPDEFKTWIDHLVAKGFAVAALAYRLAPRWSWPTQANDVQDALRYLSKNHGSYNLQADQFILFGRSAGGHLAQTAMSTTDVGIRGCIAFYAPADLVYAYEKGREDDVLSSLQLLRDFMGGSLSEKPGSYKEASPIFQIPVQAPPVLLVHGEQDTLVSPRQSMRYFDALKKAGVPVFLLSLPWATHACDHNLNGPAGQLSRHAVEFFLEAVSPTQSQAPRS